MRTYTVVLGTDPEWPGYWVSCPAMPGTLSQGQSRDEALANIAEAMELWLEVTLEDGVNTLPETPELIAAEAASFRDIQAENGWPIAVETAQVVVRVAAVA